jgi:predicted kinase
MVIADSILKNKLKNVYFIWGRGKTTIANRLKEMYGFFVYSTDESRERQFTHANSEDQPYMCRDYQKEYGVKSFWELPSEVIAA